MGQIVSKKADKVYVLWWFSKKKQEQLTLREHL